MIYFDRLGFPVVYLMRCISRTHVCISDVSDKTRHAILRRIVGPSFSNVAMTQFEPTLKRYIEQFKDALQETASQNSGRIDMTDWFNRFTFDVVISYVNANGRLAGL